MSAKIVVGTVAGLSLLAGGAVMMARMGATAPEAELAQPIESSARKPLLIVDDSLPPAMTINETPEQSEARRGDRGIDARGFQREGGQWGGQGNFDPEQMRAQMLERFDKNGDGELDEDERREMREAMRAEREAMRDRWLLDRYDKDGDGVLSDEERALAEAEREEGRERMRALEADRQAALLAAFDADGDGVLSEAESRAARQAHREWGEQMRADMMARYETDENGRFTPDAMAKLRENMRDVMSDFRFVSQFDANGDGFVTASDMPSFLDAFYNQDRKADINNDGFIDEIDLAEFQQRVQTGQSAEYVDMMQRLQSAPPGMMPGPGAMGMLFGGGMMGPGGGGEGGRPNIEFMNRGQNQGAGGRGGDRQRGDRQGGNRQGDGGGN